MKTIEKYIIFALFAIGLLSCGAGRDNGTVATTGKEKPVKTQHLTKAEFLAKVVNYETSPDKWKYLGDKPAIVDFYASWCGPCKALAPVLEELADKYDGQIYVYKIDTDKEPELAAAFGIQSIPTLIFIPMGEAPQISQGALPKSNIEEIIENVLLKKKSN